MDIFPTQYSTLSSVALNLKIQEAYGLKECSCKLLIHNVSDTYILENRTSKYIFKIYRDSHRKLDEIQGEVELLNILNAKGAKVAYPITDVQGNQIRSFNAAEGIRYGVLFSFAPGKAYSELSHSQLSTLGAEMAHVHNITSSVELEHFRKSFNIDTTLTQPLKLIKPAFVNLAEEYEFLLNTGKEIADKMSNWKTSDFGYGYCHYDFLPKNFHFDEAGNITFFDFDFAGKGILMNDITSFYIHCFLEVYYGKTTQQKADESFAVFIEAYNNLRPLTTDELDLIPWLGFAFWVFYLGFQYENYDDWSNFFFGDRYLKERVKLIRTWTEWYCKFN